LQDAFEVGRMSAGGSEAKTLDRSPMYRSLMGVLRKKPPLSRLIWWAGALVVAGGALVVVIHRRDGPDLSKLKPQAYLLEELQELSLAALKTRINVDWMGEFLTLAYYYGDGIPASYPELAASVFMPSPDALINPYTNRPIRQVAEPSPGDIQ
jgi:hypothetical protein